jgi:hypothetical protein
MNESQNPPEKKNPQEPKSSPKDAAIARVQADFSVGNRPEVQGSAYASLQELMKKKRGR